MSSSNLSAGPLQAPQSTHPTFMGIPMSCRFLIYRYVMEDKDAMNAHENKDVFALLGVSQKVYSKVWGQWADMFSTQRHVLKEPFYVHEFVRKAPVHIKELIKKVELQFDYSDLVDFFNVRFAITDPVAPRPARRWLCREFQNLEELTIAFQRHGPRREWNQDVSGCLSATQMWITQWIAMGAETKHVNITFAGYYRHGLHLVVEQGREWLRQRLARRRSAIEQTLGFVYIPNPNLDWANIRVPVACQHLDCLNKDAPWDPDTPL